MIYKCCKSIVLSILLITLTTVAAPWPQVIAVFRLASCTGESRKSESCKQVSASEVDHYRTQLLQMNNEVGSTNLPWLSWLVVNLITRRILTSDTSRGDRMPPKRHLSQRTCHATVSSLPMSSYNVLGEQCPSWPPHLPQLQRQDIPLTHLTPFLRFV